MLTLSLVQFSRPMKAQVFISPLFLSITGCERLRERLPMVRMMIFSIWLNKVSKYKFASEHIVYVLLAVELGLFTCEHYCWFGFEEHKGWAVIFALASVLLTLLFVVLCYISSLFFRTQFQYSLKTLLFFFVPVAIICSWLSTEYQQSKQQKDFDNALSEMWNNNNGKTTTEALYNYHRNVTTNKWAPSNPCPFGLTCLADIFGDDFFSSVDRLYTVNTDWRFIRRYKSAFHHLKYLMCGKITDADMEDIVNYQQLTTFILSSPNVTDTGFRNIKSLKNLEYLEISDLILSDESMKVIGNLKKLKSLKMVYLNGVITNAGIKSIDELTDLRELMIVGCKNVSNAGLKHLENLKKLKIIKICDDGIKDIDDSGIAFIQQQRELEVLILDKNNITDVGLKYLENLDKLQTLHLDNTKISDDGLKHLNALHNLKELSIENTSISDAGLKYLHSLTNLKRLKISFTKVTRKGKWDIERALPQCEISGLLPNF
jgi:hypothetical protein